MAIFTSLSTFQMRFQNLVVFEGLRSSRRRVATAIFYGIGILLFLAFPSMGQEDQTSSMNADSSVVQPSEQALMNDWLDRLVRGEPEGEGSRFGSELPWNFFCGDRSARDWMRRDRGTVVQGEWRNGTKTDRLTWKDPETGIVCEVHLTRYERFAAAEWTIYLRNESSNDSARIHDFSALDSSWTSPVMPILWRTEGSDGRREDFRFFGQQMRQSMWTESRNLQLNSQTNRAYRVGLSNSLFEADERPSATWLPFFNLQTGDDGLIVGLGWNGAWRAGFEQGGDRTTRITAGMERLDTILHPGEQIRSPLILVLYYEGTVRHAQNVFRQFALKYHTPQRPMASDESQEPNTATAARPVELPICLNAWGGTPTSEHLEAIANAVDRNLPYDCYWIDAGWYGTGTEPCPDVFHGDWGSMVGDWRVNTTRHPHSLRPISDALAAANMRFLLWFETERACWGVPATVDHPQWYLRNHDGDPTPGENVLFNLGDPEAREWLIETISGILEENQISIYREDFNMVPTSYWAYSDAPDRVGMTEMRFVEGLYAFWDALLSRHPGLMIDNCASGGRRIELETLKRSVVLWRTDYNCFPHLETEATQSHGYGLSNWVPANSISPFLTEPDTYQARSAYASGLLLSIGESGNRSCDQTAESWDWLRNRLNEARRCRPLFYGDFYPLTAEDLELDHWLAMAYVRDDLRQGMLLAFRRPNSPVRSMTFDLPGIEDNTEYTFEDADTGETWTLRGQELRQNGLPISTTTPRESRLIFYTWTP